MFWTITKVVINLFSKMTVTDKDNCFLLHDSFIAFFKVKRNDDSLECGVMNSIYLDSLYNTPID